MAVPQRTARSQPYRIGWPANVKISPELQKALGQQFANIDECLQLVFSLLREDAAAAAVVSVGAATVSVSDVVALLDGRDGDDGQPGLRGETGAVGALGAPGFAFDGRDGDDAYLSPTIAQVTPQQVAITIDGGGVALTTGQKAYLRMLRAGTISAWTILADRVGSIAFDLFKSTFAGYPPVASIVAAAPPQLVTTDHGESSTLTGWTISVAAGDVLGVSITSVATIQRVTLQLDWQR